MSTVDNPIVNNPFEQPGRYYDFPEGQPVLTLGRRPAGYYVAPRSSTHKGPVAAEQLVLYDSQPGLSPVNEIRRRVEEWRRSGYVGATRITQELLKHWNNLERTGKQRLFFCEREAAETIIWLIEAPERFKQGVKVPRDNPTDQLSIDGGYEALRRYCSKMATGSGKTVVMAMIIAWSVINKIYNKQDRRFSDGILIICPNLTIKERLKVLRPGVAGNFYDDFDLVPRSLLPILAKAKILITNWHLFMPDDDASKKKVLQRGIESDSSFSRRVLKDLGEKENLLVINDEAHHAYRPPHVEEVESDQVQLDQESVEDDEVPSRLREATVWVTALDRINKVRRINFCLDLSATPFYLKGTGHEEGSPFPWIVSDFGLVDAIESGIVKIPRVPVDDNSGQPIPGYFRLWQWVMDRLPAADRATIKRRAKPEAVLRQSEGALATLASEWKKTFEQFVASNHPVPPVMIVVCDNTDLAEIVHSHIASGSVFEELKNEGGHEISIRIDSKLLDEAESLLGPSESRADKAEKLRQVVATIGKSGMPGEQVRSVVSVMMLNEGWDAQNVTQILGLRAFGSQLLCEQVVGRGLRRTNYDDFTTPEYVDVYGIPFEVIPVQKKSVSRSEPQRLPTLVKALENRKDLEIEFPRVEGYIFDVKQKIVADVDRIPPLYVDPTKEPTEIMVKDQVGMKVGRPGLLGPGKVVREDRNPFHLTHRLQTTVFEIAADITQKLNPEVRPFVFPQVLAITWQYLENRVKVRGGAVLEEIALKKYKDAIVTRLCDAIRPDTNAGEAPILPRIERYRRIGSTSEVLFRTTKEVHDTIKSHVSHIVVDSGWEHTVAFQFEKSPHIVSFVKNDHLGFTIPYEYEGNTHYYYPDFIVRLIVGKTSEVKLILEVKGFEDEKARAKKTAAQRWIEAVNHDGRYGRWALAECKSPHAISALIDKLSKTLG